MQPGSKRKLPWQLPCRALAPTVVLLCCSGTGIYLYTLFATVIVQLYTPFTEEFLAERSSVESVRDVLLHAGKCLVSCILPCMSAPTVIGSGIVYLVVLYALHTIMRGTCRHMTTDEQLYKDIEGVLEQSCDMFKWQYQQSQQPICQSQQLSCLFECWDGICHMYMNEAKPSHWVVQLLKALKWFTPEARASAACRAATSSDLMSRAQALLAELKPPRIRALFEIADVQTLNGVASKRQRRTGSYRLE